MLEPWFALLTPCGRPPAKQFVFNARVSLGTVRSLHPHDQPQATSRPIISLSRQHPALPLRTACTPPTLDIVAILAPTRRG